jgi:capsular polysaccharide transport system permease protein
VVGYYIIYIQTEKYQSNSVITIKDLSKKQSISSLGSLVLGQGDINTKQNLELISVYIRSLDMYKMLDKDYNLTKYYSSDKLDILERLKKDTNIYFLKLNQENLLKNYNNDLEIFYDDLSATLKVSFYHTNPKTAQSITKKIIELSEKKINKIEKESAIILAKFLKEQEESYRKKYIDTIKKIINYQNRVGLIDPDINIKAKSELLANLESELIKKEIEKKAKSIKFTNISPEIKMLNQEIYNLKAQIRKTKSSLTGKKSRKKIKLNQDKFTFELLKNELMLNQELYKQSLLKVEDAKITTSQNAKKLIVITKPNLPEQYIKPNKIKNIFTLMIILLFIYQIIKISAIILVEHKD